MQTSTHAISTSRTPPLRVHRKKPTPDLAALPDQALLARRQLCELSGFSLSTLKSWAREGRGPRVTMVEGRPRYFVADVRAWLDAAREAA